MFIVGKSACRCLNPSILEVGGHSKNLKSLSNRIKKGYFAQFQVPIQRLGTWNQK